MLLPVSHGLPEDCPLAAGEIPSNHKRDDPIGPHPLRSGRRCPPAPRPASPSAPAFPLRLSTSALTTQGRRVSCSFDGWPSGCLLSENCSLLHLEGPQVLLIQGNVPKEGSWRKKKPEAELILLPWAALIVLIALTL